MIQGVEGRGIGDVVDEEKGVGFEIARGPESPILFLAGGVGKREMVCQAVYDPSYGVGVLYGVDQQLRCGRRGDQARQTYCRIISRTSMSIDEPREWGWSDLTHSCVHSLRTNRNVIDDFPAVAKCCQTGLPTVL